MAERLTIYAVISEKQNIYLNLMGEIDISGRLDTNDIRIKTILEGPFPKYLANPHITQP